MRTPRQHAFCIRHRSAARRAHGEDLLKVLAAVAREGFGLTVWQWLPGHVGTHAQHSLHNQSYPDGVGKAFDAYGPMMSGFAKWCDRYAPQLDELIFNPSASRKNGKYVAPSFWGAETWRAHTNHVHVGNDGPAS